MHIPFPAAARPGARLLFTMLFGAALASCGGGHSNDTPYTPPVTTTPPVTVTPPATSSVFAATNVVTDSGAAAPHVDANLVNGWGIAFNPAGFVWVANQGTSTSTLYDGKGNVQSLVVSIPAAAGGSAGPTGIVYNGTQDFKVSANGVTGAAPFIFVGTGGTVSGWAPSVSASVALAPASFGSFGNMLLVGNFGDGKINVYDPATGALQGTLSKADKTPIVVDGLWGIAFGNGLNDQPLNTLFYAAGPSAETHGLYGRIDPQ